MGCHFRETRTTTREPTSRGGDDARGLRRTSPSKKKTWGTKEGSAGGSNTLSTTGASGNLKQMRSPKESDTKKIGKPDQHGKKKKKRSVVWGDSPQKTRGSGPREQTRKKKIPRRRGLFLNKNSLMGIKKRATEVFMGIKGLKRDNRLKRRGRGRG